MKVYLAAPYITRNRMLVTAYAIKALGHEVTSRWLYEEHDIAPETINAAPQHDTAYCDQHILQDFQDIDEADVLWLWTANWLLDTDPQLRPEDLVSGGRHVETGYALARGKSVVILGQPENIFHRGSNIVAFDRVADVLHHLDALQALKASA